MTMSMRIALFLLLLHPLSPAEERGAIPVINYRSSGSYRTDRDAWGSVRSPSGLMYFANSEGVLQYNGVSWNLFRLPHGTAVQSIGMDREGRILVGSDSEIGLLREDPDSLRYTSLTHFLPESLRTFSQVWTIDTLAGYSYFQASSIIAVLHGDSVVTHTAPIQFGLTYRYGGRLLVQERTKGLVELRGTTMVTLDSSEFFRTRSVSAILPARGGRSFILTKYNGVFLYDGKRTVPFLSPLNDLLLKNRPYRGSPLSTGESAVGVVGLGVVIIDSAGTIRSVLSKENGLTNNTVTSVTDDGRGNVWLTGYQGISRFRYPAPVTIFSSKQGLSGTVKMMVRHRGAVYAGSIENVFLLTSSASIDALTTAGTPVQFNALRDVREDCSILLPVNDDLLASTSQGVFVINGRSSRLVTHTYALPLVRSRNDSERVFIGTFGLSSMVRRNGVWKDEGLYHGITEDIYQIIEERPDVLWLRTYNQGILRVTLAGGASRDVATIERFGITEGLPSLSFQPIAMVEGRFVAPSEKGVLCFNEAQHRFVRDSIIPQMFPGLPDGVYAMDRANGGAYWVLSDGADGYRQTLWKKQSDGTFRTIPLPFTLPSDSRTEWVFEDEGEVIWVSGTGGLFRCDLLLVHQPEENFRASIDRVRLLGNDSVVTPMRSGTVALQHTENSLRIIFSANSYIDEQQTRYQTRLDGFSDHWSSWSPEYRKEYTNLDPGTYTFRVRARNALGDISTEASFTIRIFPPWWSTWWFRTILVLLFLTVGPVIYYRRVSALQRVNEQQEQFSRQLINRQESERKRIAHELHDSISQSLLTIKNRAEMAVDRTNDPQWMREQMSVILTSSSGAIQEIKQITHNLRPYLLDRIGLTKALQSLLRTFGESSPLRMEGTVDEVDGALPKEHEIHLYRIVQEALNNIQKHAGAASVRVTIERMDASVVVTVQDDGKGFDTEKLRSGSRAAGGLGLDGIAERVRIMNGELRITSQPGSGTVLAFSLPAKGNT